MLNTTVLSAHFFLGLSVLGSLLVAQPTFQLPAESAAFRRAQLTLPDFRPAEKLSQYKRYDFGFLWTQVSNTAVVGFIGPNCQRLRVKVLTVRRDTVDFTRYYLTGKTQVADHINTFSGTLVLRQVRELRQLAARVDETISPARHEGILLADYELREDNAQLKSGVFRGVAETFWYIDKRGRLRYDDIYGTGDGYCNNQFVGTWMSYATKKSLRCNWGDYRIPNSGDFDIGAGEFSPADKYLAYGWQDVREATFEEHGDGAAARKREARAWWK